MTLRVRLLGGLDLRRGDEPVAPLPSSRAETLLAYLLLRGDAPQPRGRLAFMLWPDSTEPQARTNLRHVLHTLRHALPDADHYLEITPRTLRCRTGAPLWLDVRAFEEAVTAGRLEEAAALYGGPLLEGAYDDWVLEERERLAALHVETLDRLARRSREAGRVADAIGHAERLVRADPLREESHRLLIALHGEAGDPALALRAYHACAATLQRELGIEPSAETHAAYARLLPARAAPPAVRAPRPPFVGRAEERRRLVATWRAVEAGAARFVLVAGEPGIGKTRLAEELRTWAASRGALTAEASAYSAEGAMPYGVLADWLRHEGIAARLPRLAPAHLAELARLLPELGGAPEPLPEGEGRARLFEAAARALRPPPTAPLLLVADDLQWCDAETLQVVHYLLRAPDAARLLVAATARREELDAGHPAEELLAGLRALDRLEELHLPRLDAAETAALAAHVSDGPLGPEELARLHERTEGNPLFVVEALLAAPGAALTPRVQSAIAARLAALGDAARRLAGVAATIGRSFTAPVLADAAGLDERDLVAGLDELWRRGLIRDQGPAAYDFAHGLVREAAYRALSPPQARHHHLRAAEALQRAGAGAPAEIAAHYEAAGEPASAARWHVGAAEAALRLHAGRDAVSALERALELVRGLPGAVALELEVLAAFPAALTSVEGYYSERTARLHARALELEAGHGVELPPPLLRSIAMGRLVLGEFAAAEATGHRLRELAEQAGDDVLRVEAAYVLGIADFWRGRLEAARAHFADVLARYRPARRAEHLRRYGQDPRIVCQMRLAYTLWLLGEDEASRRELEEVRAAADASGNPYSRSITAVWAALLIFDQGDERALREAVAGLGSHVTCDWQASFSLDCFEGYLDVLDGRAAAGLARLSRAAARFAEHPQAPGITGYLARVLAAACGPAGEPRLGVETVDAALRRGRGAALWEPELRRLRAGYLGALGVPEADVRAELELALGIALRQGARAFEARVRRDLGERSRNGPRGASAATPVPWS